MCTMSLKVDKSQALSKEESHGNNANQCTKSNSYLNLLPVRTVIAVGMFLRL